MKKAKRALALALVFALVASFCVTGAAADGGQKEQRPAVVYGNYDSNGDWTQTQGGDGSYTDEQSGVTVSKTAEAVSGEDNQYEVTLKVKVPVTTNTKSASAATVLVIDRSLSMGYCAECGGESEHKSECSYTEGRDPDWISEFFGGGHWGYKVKTEDTRLYAAKTAACNFLDSYAEPNSNSLRYVAVVAFAGSAYTPVDWVNVNDSNSLQGAKNTIWDIDTASSTDLYDGLDEAEGLLNNNDIRNVEKRFVIALTDGSPTENKQGAVTKANEIKTDGNRSATIYTVCFGAANDDVSFWYDGDWHSITVSEYLSDYIATQPKQGSDDTYAFDAADADELYAAFEALTEDIEDSLERLTVTDPMAKGVTLDTDFTGNDSVSVEDDDTIKWDLSESKYTDDENNKTRTYTLSYTVTVNPDDFKDQKAGYYPLNGRTFLTIPAQDEGDTESTVQFPVPGVYVTPTVTENTSSITIEVYVDGTKVTLTDDTHLKNYISNLTDDAGTPTFEYNVEDGVIKGTYNYEQFDSADIVLTPNDDYVLQGVSGMFIKGQYSWKGINEDEEQADVWTIDNVQGDSVLKVYLNTKYSVEYEVPDDFEAPEADGNTYITVEGLQDVSAPNFDGVTDGNTGVSGGWTNNNLETTINLKTVPTGTTGWYNENDFLYTQPTLNVSDAAAASSGYDNNGDHIFTFTATAKEYTVTYHANTSADDPTLYTDSNTVTHGESYTVLGNDTTNFNNTGYTFAGWATSADGDVVYQAGEEITDIKENVNLYAKWTAITGTLTVTKTVEADKGTVTLPDAFTITVTGTSGAAEGDSYTLTIGMSDDENIEYSYDEASGAYKWVISGAALGNYSVSERNTQVSGYKLDTSASTQSDTMTLTDTATSDSAELKNVYVKDAPGLGVEKTVYSVNGNTTVPEMVEVGDVIVYQIVVKNTGNVALENISVEDELVDNELHSDEDCTETASATISSLEAGGSATFYAKYEVTAADAEAGFVENTATAKAGEDGPEDSGKVTVNVTPQYTLTVNHRYDTQNGEVFEKTEETLNKGDEWSATAKEDVERDGMNYIFDASRSSEKLSGTISGEVTVDLVYVKDEWKDNPDGDSETGGDGIPDYRQALIKYEAETGGTVDPTINVETLTDDDGDGKYSGEVKAESTAIPEDGNVFVSWSGNGYSPEVQTNELSHGFTAEGGKEYVYTASFKTGTTGATVDKQLVSYTRDGVTVDEIPADFKARVGDVLNYAITIENTGEIALEGVTVSDTLWGSGVTSAMVGETETNVSGGSCKVDVASGSSVTITYSYTVQADDIGKTITNTATVDMDDEEPGDDPKDEEEVTVDDYSVTITPADIVAYTGGDGYSAVVGANDQYINNSESGLPEPGYHVVLSDAVVDWLNDNGVAAGDGSESEAANLEDVLSFTYDDGTNKRNWSLQYVGVYSYNASGNPSAYVYSIVTETAGAPSVSLKYFDDLNGDGVADDNEVITSDDILMSAGQVNHTYKMTIEGGGLDQSQVKAVLKAGGKSLTTDIEIGIGELTVLSTTDEETTKSIAGSVAGVDSGVITAVGNDSITYYVNESGVAFDDGDLVSRVQLLIDEVTNETSGEFETAMAEAAFNAISADLRNAEYEMCYMDLVDTENGNAKVTFSGGELSIYWPLPDGASASDSFYIVHFTELDREHDAVGTDVLDTTNKDVIAGEVMRIGGEYYVTFDVGSFSPFVLVYGDDGGDEPWWPPIGPGDDDDDGDDDVDREFVPKWLNIDDHYAYIIGYEDGTVRPQGNITRAEVATIFFRLLTDEVREEYWSTESGYSDVSSSDWYNNAISTLSNLGVITGYEDGTFRPNASISRAEFVTIATRFFDYTAEYEGTFSDVSYSSWYADFVQAAVDMGLVNGYENGTFRPNASITRAEAVAIVNRVLLRRPDADHLLPWSVMNTFSDNVLESAWYYEDIQEATNSHDYEWLKSGVEDWTEKLPERDWAALEREWSSAYDAPGGEVTG